MMSDYRDILVLCETRRVRAGEPERDIAKQSLETLTKARELADTLGARVEALVLGESGIEALGEKAIHNGADVALLAEHEDLRTGNVDAAFAAALPILKERKPEIVLMSATPLGLDLAPRLGAALGTGALSDATQLAIDETDRLLVAKRLTYDGSVEAVATIPKHRPQIASLRPGAVRPGYPDDSRYGRVEKVEVAIPSWTKRVELLSIEESPANEVPLEQAEIVVGAGLGLAGEMDLVDQLAKALGGAPAASRAAVHAGLAPPDRQVGATGKRIAPKMYVAAGVSGAFEHWLGVLDSEVVVAINPDKSAPIFQRAQYGLVGDAKEIIRNVLAELKRR